MNEEIEIEITVPEVTAETQADIQTAVAPSPAPRTRKPRTTGVRRGVKKGTVRGKYKKAVTDEDCVKALFKHYGLIGPAAKTLGISRDALEDRINANDQLQVAVKEASEQIVDIATQSIIRLLQADDVRAVIFCLKCKGKPFGWVEDTNINLRSSLNPEQARKAISEMFNLQPSEEAPQPEDTSSDVKQL